jgi:hypothetical protein
MVAADRSFGSPTRPRCDLAEILLVSISDWSRESILGAGADGRSTMSAIAFNGVLPFGFALLFLELEKPIGFVVLLIRGIVRILW